MRSQDPERSVVGQHIVALADPGCAPVNELIGIATIVVVIAVVDPNVVRWVAESHANGARSDLSEKINAITPPDLPAPLFGCVQRESWVRSQELGHDLFRAG